MQSFVSAGCLTFAFGALYVVLQGANLTVRVLVEKLEDGLSQSVRPPPALPLCGPGPWCCVHQPTFPLPCALIIPRISGEVGVDVPMWPTFCVPALPFVKRTHAVCVSP